MAEGNGLFHLVQEQFTPQFIRSLLFRPPLTGRGILGNFSVIEVEADCWSKAQSDSRYPLVATFNSLGSTVTSIDGRVTALENAPGVAPTADLTVNSLTATSFVQTPLLQSAAADLQIRNATTTIRAEDGTLLASFAAGSIGLEQDITVRSDRTLNATTADFAQFFVGSTAATGAFTSSSSITATQQIESDLRVQAPLLRCDPAASVLTVTGGTQGVLVDDTLRVNGVIAPEASLPFLSLSGGSSGVQVLSPLLEQIAVVPNGSVGMVARNAAATGDATLILDSNAQNGLVELKALAGGGVQMNTLFQFMSFNTTNGLANLAIEPNIGGSNNGELIFGYGFVNLSDKALKTNVRDLSEKELQETFDAVEPRMYGRIEGGKDQIGFIAQEVQATPLGERVCKTKNLDGRDLMTLDYQKLNVVFWGVVKSLQKRIEKLEKKKRSPRRGPGRPCGATWPGRCWPPSPGAWGRARRRGRTSGSRRTWWTSLAEHAGAQQVRAGGDGRLHPGSGHESAAQQAVGHGDAGGRGDHPGAGPGGGRELRGHDGPGERVWGAGGSPAGAGGAPGEAAERPERHGGDRPGHPDPEEGPGGEGGPGRRRLGRARGGGDGSLQRWRRRTWRRSRRRPSGCSGTTRRSSSTTRT